MRLDNEERAALKKIFAEKIVDASDEVYLFGSRLDENKKGGDIDLLVFSKKDSFTLSMAIQQIFFLHCEEKIDVTVMNPTALTAEQKAFLNVITYKKLEI